MNTGDYDTGWINVMDGLPPIGERVEVKGESTLIACRRWKKVWFSSHDGPPWEWESHDYRGRISVTHWRPVPQRGK